MAPDAEWRAKAECRDQPTDVFFPPINDEPALRRAKAICALCPVQPECADAGADQAHGVWAGLDEIDRGFGSSYNRQRRHPTSERSEDRREVIDRMRKRGYTNGDIALHLEITRRSVVRLATKAS